MRRTLAALLLTLAAVSAHAQTVTLSACNPGKTDVDVYFAQGSNVVLQHVRPSDCARLAGSKGALAPGVVAVGFADVQGQWGGVHRYERVPDFGPGVAERTTQTLEVMRGATRVSIPAQFQFRPPTPACITWTPPTSSDSLFLPEPITRCDDFKYDVNVLAYPDTREVAFQRFCQSCDDKVEARKTPEQRAQEEQARDAEPITGVESLPVGARIVAEAHSGREESMDRYRESLERDPTKWDHIGWSDVPRYAREAVSNVAMQGSAAVLQGTISEVKRHNASEPWIDVFFQESPDHRFILCTEKPDVLSDIFGADYGTAMVGKKIEVEGLVTRCLGGTAGVLVKLQHQIKLVGTGPGMARAVTPPPFQFPEDPDSRVLSTPPSPGSAAYDAGQLAFARQRLERQCQALYTPPLMFDAHHHELEPDQGLVKADVAACIGRFDLAKLVPHEQAAIRYCIVNHNYEAVPRYTRERDQVLRAYNECMARNDPVIIPCEDSRRSSPSPPIDDACPPMPSSDAAAAMLRGDAGPIPSTPPGLPAIQLPPASAKAAMARALGETASSAQPVVSSAPPPAPAQRPPVAPAAPARATMSPEEVAAQDRARANEMMARSLRTQACMQEAMKQLGPNALSDPAGLQRTVLACMQR